MGILILNILLQYLIVGFICSVLIDLLLRYSKATSPFTLLEIIGVIIAWPVVLASIFIKVFNDKDDEQY